MSLRAFVCFVVVVSSGCVKTTTVTCDDGTVCPAEQVCDDVHNLCVSQAQLAGCIDQTDLTECSYPGVDKGACSTGVCLPAGCGNGTVEPPEVCDDRNTLPGDGCATLCNSDETCGNGTLDVIRLEQCDDGNSDESDGCSAECVVERCGDGVVQAGEQCDDGNNASNDGCRADCLSNESCGNGVIDSHLPNNRFSMPSLCLDSTTTGTHCAEACDDGNQLGGDGCSPNCLSDERCLNGIRDLLEICDDGDNNNNDTCNNSCSGAAGCGNGVVDGEIGEECDGESIETFLCDLNCTKPVCGDIDVNNAAGETCDPGVVGGFSATCDADCTPPLCGDGIVNLAANELCDPEAEGVDTTACDADCTPPVCGDNHVNTVAGEACDPGTPGSDSGNCDHDCTAPSCGDGIVNTVALEECEPPVMGNCDVNCQLP